ncbi:MAG: helix-turn-helix domain-containing protein [Firmicutes bacterium]|nr:helix-turn-helix domain-containing protein [Bacillota bacterium]
MTFREAIADNIKRHIKYSGKTNRKIAEEVGVTPTVIGDYAAGRGLPSLEVLKKLCKSLDCSYEDILGNLND